MGDAGVRFRPELKPYNEDNANWLSKFTFFWTNSLPKAAVKGCLAEPEDLAPLPRKLDVREVDEKYRCSAEGSVSFLKSLHHYLGAQFYPLLILKVIYDGLSFANPILIGYMITFVGNHEAPFVNGVYLSVAMVGCNILMYIVGWHYLHLLNHVTMKIRTIVNTVIYRQCVQLPKHCMSGQSIGQITNLITMDADRLVSFSQCFHDIWSIPFQIGIALYLLYKQIGLASMVSLCVVVCFWPLVHLLSKKMGTLFSKFIEAKDVRVKLFNEALLGMTTLKLMALEEKFQRRLFALRQSEMKYLKRRKYLDALSVCIWAALGLLTMTLTIVVYVLLGNELTAAKVFTSLALCNLFMSPLINLPWFLNSAYEAWVSKNRLARFLRLTPISLDMYYAKDFKPLGDDGKTVLALKNVEITWTEGEPLIRNLSLTVKQGELIGICGVVGCGKSTVLYAILGEAVKSAGLLHFQDWTDGVAFAGHEPWLRNRTIRDNIVFVKSFDYDVYWSVIDACMLRQDFSQLPFGDQTRVGEYGRFLSGGQRARVALARALYSGKAVYLLDDPFSAQDINVAKALFNNVILNLLQSKTVLLVTHRLEFLSKCDRILLLKSDGTYEFGKPSRILPAAFEEKAFLLSAKEQLSEPFEPMQSQPREGEAEDEEKEGKEVGLIRCYLYKRYFQAIGYCLVACIFVSFILMQGTRTLSDLWLTIWIRAVHEKNRTLPPSTSFRAMTLESSGLTEVLLDDLNAHRFGFVCDPYLMIYIGIAGVNSVFVLFRAFLYAYGCLKAARTFHDRLVNKIFLAPLRFHATTSVGRIINRVSGDVFSVDDALPSHMNRLAKFTFELLGILVILTYSLPWCLICLIPLSVLYWRIQRTYRLTCCSLRRLSRVTLSPLYSHFVETLNGGATIRAFRMLPEWTEEFLRLLSLNMRSCFSECTATVWFVVQLDIVGVITISSVCSAALIEHYLGRGNAGLFGLALTYVVQLNDLLDELTTSYCETEKSMVSLERIEDFLENLDSEESKVVVTVPDDWPQYGRLIFKNVTLQYNDDCPAALNDVSFVIEPGEFVGIVGRTGAGKSSLFNALFRIYPVQSGLIIVDEINLATVSVKDLRLRFGIIPQDPFLFTGLLRDNLDINGEFSDAQLYETMESCGMKQLIEELGGLHTTIVEGGGNFSAGQRQLVCLARAFLARKKIICIDEATSHMDPEMELLLQRLMSMRLKNITVLTIAHRLSSVMHCDRVIVMGKGCVVEIGCPRALINDKTSTFYAMAMRDNLL